MRSNSIQDLRSTIGRDERGIEPIIVRCRSRGLCELAVKTIVVELDGHTLRRILAHTDSLIIQVLDFGVRIRMFAGYKLCPFVIDSLGCTYDSGAYSGVNFMLPVPSPRPTRSEDI